MNKKSLVVVLCAGQYLTPCLAEITTDGTVGRATHLAGPHFKIDQDLGTLKGHNLFHSFDHFNLSKNESARFTGDSHIQNVISRVTGGDASKIDGTLRSTIGKANFFFINPAGVVFGKHAQVNVPAAFYTSTAAELKFADGGKFSALHPNAKLSMAVPEAFGFLGKQTGTIAVNGSHFEFKNGAVVQLSANKISMDKASINGKEMDLQLAAVGAAKQVIGVNILPNKALQGDITLRNTRLTTEGNDKGRIAIRGGQVNFANSRTIVANIGDKDMLKGQGIDIQAMSLTIKNSFLTSFGYHTGSVGEIKINTKGTLKIFYSTINSGASGKKNKKYINIIAKNILIDRDSIVDSSSHEYGLNACDINITAYGELILTNGGMISSGGTYSYGGILIYADDFPFGGSVNIKAKSIKIDGSSGIYVPSGNNIDRFFSDKKVNISADKLVITNGGKISSSSDNGNKAVGLDIKVKFILIDGKNSTNDTGIFSNGYAIIPQEPQIIIGSAKSGYINILNSNKITIINGGKISSSNYFQDDAGYITISADTIRVDGGNLKDNHTGIFSETDNNLNPQISTIIDKPDGRAGIIKITAKNNLLINNGSISNISNTYSKKPFKVTNGEVYINSPYIELNNSQINSRSTINAPASQIIIYSNQLKLDGQSKIITTTKDGNGGLITIKGLNKKQNADWIHLNNSQITTSVDGKKGNGGDININADALVMDNGFIQANTNAKNGSGGAIDLKNVKNLIASGGNLQIGGTKPLEFEPNSGNNIIQAAAPTGISGNITNNAPQLNIAGALVNLKTTQPDLNRAGRDPCSSIVRQSTIKKGGKGGVAVFHKGRDSLAIDSLLDTPSSKQTQTTQPSHMVANQDCQSKHQHPQQHTLAHNAE